MTQDTWMDTFDPKVLEKELPIFLKLHDQGQLDEYHFQNDSSS